MSRKQVSSETCKKPFASRLAAVMDERGITQKQLAAVIGKKPQTVSLYRLGQSEPDASTILVIAEYLNVTVDWLIGRDNAPMIYGSTVSEAAATLGLTDKAAEILLDRQEFMLPIFTVSHFIESNEFWIIVESLYNFALDRPSFENDNGSKRICFDDGMLPTRDLYKLKADYALKDLFQKIEAGESKGEQNAIDS